MKILINYVNWFKGGDENDVTLYYSIHLVLKLRA